MPNDALAELERGFMELDMEAALRAANAVISGDGKATVKEAVDVVTRSLEAVGKRFQDGQWYLAELVYAGEIAKDVMKALSPLMQSEASPSRGTLVIGTVAGDLHDLGKNIVVSYARSAGFAVVDLGVDVSAQKFAAAVRDQKPAVLGMSCLLTSTEGELAGVIGELKKQDLRNGLKVVIGGAALSERVARDVGADAFAPDAVTGVDMMKKWNASA
jgi:methanogenic corrinoid protein MtbC1